MFGLLQDMYHINLLFFVIIFFSKSDFKIPRIKKTMGKMIKPVKYDKALFKTIKINFYKRLTITICI